MESLLPIASAGTATRAQWAELAWRSAAVLCAAGTGDAGDTPEGSLQALSTLAPERSAEGVPSPLQTTLGLSDDEANAIGRASRLVLKSGLLEGEASSVDAEAAVRDAVMAIVETTTGPKDSGIPAPDEAGGGQAAAVPEESNNGANPQQAEALVQRGASEIVDYVSRHPRAGWESCWRPRASLPPCCAAA